MNTSSSSQLCAQQMQIAVIYAENRSWLHNWLGMRLRSWGQRSVAEDLVHDTFVRILSSKAHSRHDRIEQPRAYLTAVAKGVLVSWIRRQALERAWLEELANLPEALHPSPEHQSIILETLGEISAMLDELKPKVKQAFLMATLDGMKQRDIAHALGVSIPTVKNYIRKAYATCLGLMPDE